MRAILEGVTLLGLLFTFYVLSLVLEALLIIN